MTGRGSSRRERRLRPRPLIGVAAVGAVLFLLPACGRDAAKAAPPSLESPGDDYLRPGDLALDYVTDDRFTSLLVEVDFVEGATPTEEALERLEEVLRLRLRKPGGVRAVIDTEIPALEARRLWRDRDIRALELAYRHHFSGEPHAPEEAVLWVVYLGGASEHDADGRALGLAIGSSQIAVFAESVAASVLPEERVAAEALTLVHEAGHIFGLVNNGVPMGRDHEDPLHPYHDAEGSDPGCVMHFAIESGSLLDLEDTPLDFGPRCRRDLQAVGGPPARP